MHACMQASSILSAWAASVSLQEATENLGVLSRVLENVKREPNNETFRQLRAVRDCDCDSGVQKAIPLLSAPPTSAAADSAVGGAIAFWDCLCLDAGEQEAAVHALQTPAAASSSPHECVLQRREKKILLPKRSASAQLPALVGCVGICRRLRGRRAASASQRLSADESRGRFGGSAQPAAEAGGERAAARRSLERSPRTARRSLRLTSSSRPALLAEASASHCTPLWKRGKSAFFEAQKAKKKVELRLCMTHDGAQQSPSPESHSLRSAAAFVTRAKRPFAA